MISRRGFAGFASCALCAITGFVATDASAQATPPAATPGVKRRVLSQMDGPAPGFTTLVVEVEVDAGIPVARHTHPGIESGYVVDGEIELAIGDAPAKVFKAGEAFQIPTGVVHGSDRPGRVKARITSTYVVEKGKPLATPA